MSDLATRPTDKQIAEWEREADWILTYGTGLDLKPSEWATLRRKATVTKELCVEVRRLREGLEAIAVKTGRDWLVVRIPKRDPRKPVGRPKGKR